jgi:selenocysteine-specific elongation factor
LQSGALPQKVFNLLVETAVAEGKVVALEAGIRLAEHSVRFAPAQQAHVDRLLAQFRAQPYTPPSVAEAITQVGADVFGALVEQGQLVRVSDDVAFESDAYRSMVDGVLKHLEENGKITVAEVRDRFGASRKYALALMEHLDERRVTRRVGDERVLR